MLIANKMSPSDFTENDRIKFESLFIKSDEDACWVWGGATDKDGYGDFCANLRKNKAHRVSYVIYKQECIKKGLLIRHTCDNPSCVNPNHLISGTVQDNSDDMKKRNRQAFGERNFKSKLKEEQVYDILESYYFGNKTITDLEEDFSIANSMVSAIVNGKNWKYVYEIFMEKYDYPEKPNYCEGALAGEKNGRALLRSVDIYFILESYHKQGKTRTEIAKEWKVEKHVIDALVTGKTWKAEYKDFFMSHS